MLSPIGILDYLEPVTDISVKELAMKFSVKMAKDETNWWFVECPSLPGCMSQGRTREEALENIAEAISLYLETRDEEPEYEYETHEVEVAV
ncbi:hypothetical protein BH09SUM1_BH09SUM1_23980 [soil metagenome]